MIRTAISPEDALARLAEGNQRFVEGRGQAERRWHPELTAAQRPFAVIFGCSDSRAPAEYVFDQGLGDLFVIRVAGNIVAPSLVGSVEFAVERFGTRLVVVMGHTRCGAVEATLKATEESGGAPPESSNLRSIVARIQPHVAGLSREGDPDVVLRNAVEENARASAAELRRASPVLGDFVGRGAVKIVSAVFELETGAVRLLG